MTVIFAVRSGSKTLGLNSLVLESLPGKIRIAGMKEYEKHPKDKDVKLADID